MAEHKLTERGKLIRRREKLRKELLSACPELMTAYLASEAALAMYKAAPHKRYQRVRGYPNAFKAALEWRRVALTPQELAAELIEGGFETNADDPARAQGLIMASLAKAVPRGLLKLHGDKLVLPAWTNGKAPDSGVLDA